MSKVLVCPLNWGIGHATRCMPIINGLKDRGHDVIIATDGEALSLLRMEYPDLKSYELPSYSVRYPTENIILNLITRVPKIVRTIGAEKKVVNSLVKEEGIDVVISDNRFGCYSETIRSIFITHQINLITPNKVLDRWVRKFNTQRILKFDECWIPDFKKAPGLSGHLAHDHSIPAKYIGPISRMRPLDVAIENEFSVVLSGPEPQRTYLEKEILDKIKDVQHPVIFVGGNFTDETPDIVNPNIKYTKLQNAQELNQTYCSSGFVICRSGYSSMMDLAVLGKKALIIPTPGQTEQEYLAEIYDQQKWHLKQRQGTVNIDIARTLLNDYDGISVEKSYELLNHELDQLA